ncbi:MAG TPA: DUF2071 domain-containing protein [Vicinamibacterales bacterium]|nr:DUF2071 domain-containing protein [Vicinamibacterales bacterium]
MFSDFNHEILDRVAHRPWPMPERPWVMTQTWHDLLFAHWPIEARQLVSKIPPEFPLDLYDGVAWIAVVPFRMSNVGPRAAPPVPTASAFPELNVRTYVTVDGKPGVYFFSLDAASAIAVAAARALFNLPYYRAAMSLVRHGREIEFASTRRDGGAELAARYGPAGEAFEPRAGSLEYFLTERYCLYNKSRRGTPYRLEIHHPPWALHVARGQLVRNTMVQASGLALPTQSPLLHFVERQDVVAWLPDAVA